MYATAVLCFIILLLNGNNAVESDDMSIEGLHQFAGKVYQQLANTTSNNLLISPITIQTLLALTATGASQETAREIYETLSLPIDDHLQSFFENAAVQLKIGEFHTLNTTNAVLYNKNLALLAEFEDAAKERFGVNLLADEAVGNGELVLNSELFFEGLWSKRFDKRSVYKSSFFARDEETVKVETMHGTGNYYYYDDRELKVSLVEIPFKGQEVALTFALPYKNNSLEQLEERLVEVLAEKKFKPTYLTMSLPKFTIKSDVDYTQILKELGLTKVFDERQADFTKIADNRTPLHIGSVHQTTSLQIDEKGGRGASVRSVLYPKNVGTQRRAKAFIVDRPFLFFLRKNGLLILLGRVVKPEFQAVL